MRAAAAKRGAKKARKGESEARLHPDLDRYHSGKTKDGRRTLDIGDATAKALRSLDLDGVYQAAAKALGESEKELRKALRAPQPRHAAHEPREPDARGGESREGEQVMPPRRRARKTSPGSSRPSLTSLRTVRRATR